MRIKRRVDRRAGDGHLTASASRLRASRPEFSMTCAFAISQSGVVTTAIASKSIWEHPVAWSPDGQYMLVSR